jgi:transposase-like protein
MKKTRSDVPQKVDASTQFCPNVECPSRGLIGQGNIVSHGSKRPRCKCKTCGKTFSTNAGTALAGLRKPTELIVIIITLLSYGCPTQAIVHAFELDERTVASWQQRAGKHCELVHKEKIERGLLDLIHVQADAHLGKNERSSCLGSTRDDGINTLMDCGRGKQNER